MKQTPWKNSFEFEHIGDNLLSALHLSLPDHNSQNINHLIANIKNNDKTNHMISSQNDLSKSHHVTIKNATHFVSIWRSRSPQGRLPHAVETTACLAELLLKDAMNINCCSTMELRLAYSTALIRGVNGFADASYRHSFSKINNSNSISVAHLCDRLGLPRWIVDIRHDASHSILPSLPCLRVASRTLLGYLGERYWSVLSDRRKNIQEEALILLMKSCSGNILDCSSMLDDGTTKISDNEMKEPRRKRTLRLKYAKEFVQKIPIEIGLSVILEFLVRGPNFNMNIASTDVNYYNDLGVLTKANAFLLTQTENDSNFENNCELDNESDNPQNENVGREQANSNYSFDTKIISQYCAFLKTIHKACCGFVNALFIELAHTLFSIEQNCYSSKHEILRNEEEHKCNHRTIASNIYSWIQYLLSNDFCSVINLSSPKSSNITNNNISSNSSCFYATYTKLQSTFKLELNSICDICMEKLDEFEKKRQKEKRSLTFLPSSIAFDVPFSSFYHETYTFKLLTLLESILGASRVECKGLLYHDSNLKTPKIPPIMNKKRQRQLDLEYAEKNMQGDEDCYNSHMNEVTPNEIEEGIDKNEEENVGKNNELGHDCKIGYSKMSSSPLMTKLTLEDIEGFLSSSDSESDERINENITIAATVDENTKNSLGEDEALNHSDDHVGKKKINLMQKNNICDDRRGLQSKLKKPKWELCTSWDPSPIGILPGYQTVNMYKK